MPQSEQTVVEAPEHFGYEEATAFQERLNDVDSGNLVIDFSHCIYISSAGIRSLIVAAKMAAQRRADFSLRNVSPEVYRIIDLTGLTEILSIPKPVREISIEGLPKISEGVCGECFQLDHETVVKLYRAGIEPEIAEQEKQFARAAFVMGIPTALSFDVVRFGNRTGVVYEMLDAELFSRRIQRNPDRVDAYAKLLSDIAGKVHEAEGDPRLLPNLKQRMSGYIDALHPWVAANDIELLHECLSGIPDSNNCVHFDLHTSNIMLRGDEPLIIDMGDLSRGSFLFDLGLLYMIYGVTELDLCEMATGIPAELGQQFWAAFEKYYFASRPSRDREFFERNKYFLSALRMIVTVSFLPQLREMMIGFLNNLILPRIRAEHQAA